MMKFNQIIIVDSIPNGERNTARELQHDVGLCAIAYTPAPAILYERINGGTEFLTLLNRLSITAHRTGDIPVVHIECHGNNDGLYFADSSFLLWNEMKGSLIDLNIATKMNLLVVVAACDGSAIVNALALTDRAPLHGLIGPTRQVAPGELERSYLALYATLLQTRSAREAVDAMQAATPDTFVYRTAEWLFQHVWDYYQATHETPEARLERGRRCVADPPADYDGPPVAPEQFAELLADKNREFFDLCRHNFFLCDLYASHAERFPIRYEAIQ